MTDIRDRIEHGFGALGGFLAGRPWLTVIFCAIVAAGAASGIPRMDINMSNEAFLHEDDPTLARYHDFKDTFGRDDAVIIAIESDTLFSAATLARIKALHDELATRVPYLNDITSLVNARNTRGEGDRLVVDDLMRQWPRTAADRSALKARVMANPIYRNRLISGDGRITTVMIEFDAFTSDSKDGADVLSGFESTGAPSTRRPLNDAENRSAVAAVRSIVGTFNGDDFRLYLAGTPVVSDALKVAIQADIQRFMAIAIILIALCLYVMFRRISGVVLPLVVVATALISTLGLMGHIGVPIMVTTSILPSFLLAVGVGGSVHLLAIFFQHLRTSGDRRASIAHAMGHSGLAVVMTSLTTAAGLGSFALAEVRPIASLGALASVGVLLALIYTILLLPALLALIPVAPTGHAEGAGPSRLDRILTWVGEFSTTHARPIVAGAALLFVFFAASAGQLRFSHDVLAWLPSDWPVRQATHKVDHDLRGSVTLEFLLDTGRENGLYDRDVLVKLDRMTRELEALERNGLFVGKATSVADTLQEIHQALNGNAPGSRVIPADPELIPQEFLLFENSGSDDLTNVVDSQFRVARFTAKMPWRDTLEYVPLVRELERRFQAEFGPGVTVTTTGIMKIFSQTLNAGIRSAGKSYMIALAVITVLMILLIGNLKLGLASMAPNLTPIVMVVGLMWWVGVPLNMFTMLVGSVAIGLAVDDTIHFMHNFRRYYGQSGDVPSAVGQTLHTTGRAMLITSVVLATGFYIFLFASMNNVIQFGLLTGSAIVLALLYVFFLAPAMMVLLNPAPVVRPVAAVEERG